MTRKSSGNSKDRRIAKTRAALAGALLSLLHKQHLEDITIQQLCDTANVARSSFYVHFGSVSELLDVLIQRNFESMLLTKAVGQSPLDWLVDHVAGSRMLFQRSVNGERGSILFERFKAGFAKAVAADYRSANADITELQLHFIVGGAFEILRQWGKTWKPNQLPTVKKSLRSLEWRVLSMQLNL